jgi:anti-sigma factor RsiW
MMQHLDDQVLSDLADDALDARTRSDAEAHLAACDACFSRLQRMRVLVAQATALPATMPAPPDEWQRIRARLGHESRVSVSPWRTRRSVLLAAGLALVIASSAVTALIVGGEANVAARPAAPTAPVVAVTPRLAALEREYAMVTRDLEQELSDRKHTLAPETIAAVERSLRTIDAAIAEARAALARDPASETLARLLVAGHDQKVELLRHATRLATQS